MKFKLFFDYGDDYVDSLVIEGDSIDELQERANKEVAKRSPNYYWSEPLEETNDY